MLHVGKSINETIRQQARLQVLRLEYIREFGRQPPGGCVATDSEWIKDQLDHADEVKRQTRLCQLIGEARRTKGPFRLPLTECSPVRFMTHPQIIEWLQAVLEVAQCKARALGLVGSGSRPPSPSPSPSSSSSSPSSSPSSSSSETDTSSDPSPTARELLMSSGTVYVPRIDPTPPPPPAVHVVRSDSEAGSDVYEFDRILSKRLEGGLPLYHVLWTSGEKTWEPIESFSDVQHVLRFEAEAEAVRADCGGRIQLPAGKPPYCVGVAQALGLEGPALCEKHRAAYEEDRAHPSKRPRRPSASPQRASCTPPSDSIAPSSPITPSPPRKGSEGAADEEEGDRRPLVPTNLEARFAAAAADAEADADADASAEAEAAPLHQCYVCLERHPVARGIGCTGAGTGEQHRICDDCLEHMVASWAIRDGRDRRMQELEGRLTCQLSECGADYLEQDIAQHTDPDVFDKYIANRMRIAAARAETAVNEQHQAQLVGAATETLAEQIGRMRLDVLETVVATRCPACKMHFDGFQGCFVLECDGFAGGNDGRRVGCGAFFCAWCHQTFETDAEGHDHLLGGGSKCQGVLPVRRRSRQFKGRLYGSDRDYQTATKERRKRLLREYLAKIESASVRAALLVELKRDLRGVVPSNFYSDLYPKRQEASEHEEEDEAASSEDEA